MLELTNFTYRYPGNPTDFELRVPKLSLAAGEIVYLRGPSGCGKTTFMKLLTGVLPSSLESACLGVFDEVGYVMHESTLLPWTTPWRDLESEAALRRAQADHQLFFELCKVFGMEPDALNLRTPKLSLGMRQRVEIAKALSFRPRLLVLDEAFSGIDNETKIIVMQRLLLTVAADRMTIIGTSHQPTDLLRFAQRIQIIREGLFENEIRISRPVSERLSLSIEDLFELEQAKGLLAS